MNPYRLSLSQLWPAIAVLAVVPPMYAAPAFPLKVSENRPQNTAPPDRSAVNTVAGPGGMMAHSPVTFPNEEFVGPFASWRDAQRDYGARGDGQADDTAALQRALDSLVQHTNSCVLYLPAGTYRLTGSLQTVRKAHTDCQGVAIIGEDPARTILRWDGTNGGTMFQWDAWYSKISRLTFDGAGRAGTALLYGPAFSTYNETSDLIFRDATNGLVFGGPRTFIIVDPADPTRRKHFPADADSEDLLAPVLRRGELVHESVSQ
jgi:hypothetical protein